MTLHVCHLQVHRTIASLATLSTASLFAYCSIQQLSTGINPNIKRVHSHSSLFISSLSIQDSAISSFVFLFLASYLLPNLVNRASNQRNSKLVSGYVIMCKDILHYKHKHFTFRKFQNSKYAPDNEWSINRVRKIRPLGFYGRNVIVWSRKFGKEVFFNPKMS